VDRMDYTIAGHDIDAKFSLNGVWQIPTEAMEHLCLLMAADDARSAFQVGVVRITAGERGAGVTALRSVRQACGPANRCRTRRDRSDRPRMTQRR
jgi:Restriction endonuclease NaeI